MSEVNLSITEIEEVININTSETLDQVAIEIEENVEDVSLVVDELTENININISETSEPISISTSEEVVNISLSISEVEEVTSVTINEGPEGEIEKTFETISKNLKAYPFEITYQDESPVTIAYDLGSSLSIIKSFTYTEGFITKITLSGDVSAGVNLNKNLIYNEGILTNVFYK